LQTEHFRRGSQVVLDLQALKRCLLAAVEADLLDGPLEAGEQDDRWREVKIRFLATAWDLAADIPRRDTRTGREVGVRSPAVCLRTRIERGGLYRISDPGRRWARQQITEYREEESQRAASVEARAR
jgi:hypothetical protein